ncbi:MAG: mechanosensitive ion channel [Lachnospiraceae bacterium]|nr:mechanosensitive ion channel [Lachnospiraceae bacterium]
MDALEAFWSAAWPKLFEIGKVIVVALLIWYIGKKVIKLALKLVKGALERSKVDDGVQSFLMSLVRILLYGVLIVILAGTVGIETGSIIALLGSAGLAIGLALQGSLSNFAGGVLILILKPFKIGDYIVANGMEGTVTGIDIFYTKLRTGDNRVVVLPNGTLSNSDLINASQEPIRRVDMVASVDYESDIKKVKAILFDIGSNLEYSFEDEGHPIQVYVDTYGDSAINVGLRFWVNAGDYWAAKWTANEQIKEKFDAAGISIPFNQLDVMIKNK